MKISIFGGSNLAPSEPLYAKAVQLGQSLAQRGHIVITGGYMGFMEAVSRGANENGGTVIGITCDEIEKWRPVGANPWVNQEIRVEFLCERIDKIIKECDLAIALPGGIGTLAEITLAWNLIILGTIRSKRLLIVGTEWKKVLENLFSSSGKFIADNCREKLIFYKDIEHLILEIDNLPIFIGEV